MKRTILFMIDSLNCGGAEKSLVSLLPLLNYSKYDVDLMITRRGGVFEGFIDSRVKIVNFSEQQKVIAVFARFLFSLLLRIRKNIHAAELKWSSTCWSYKPLKKEYDVAIAYQQGFPTYFIAKKVHAKKKIAWVNVNIFNANYRFHFNQKFYNYFNRIVPVSNELLKILQKNYPQFQEKYRCIYDVVNPLFIGQCVDKGIKLPVLQNKIVTVGRMEHQKNYPLAVETAKILKGYGLDFKWYFVGDGSDRKQVESLINNYQLDNYIELIGMTPNPYPYIAAADIYVQTSRFEGFGLTIAEAKILKKPIVSTNFDVVHDQIEHGKNGLIADMTAESLAQNILKLFNDSTLRDSIISNLKSEENTTYITEIKKVEQLLDEY